MLAHLTALRARLAAAQIMARIASGGALSLAAQTLAPGPGPDLLSAGLEEAWWVLEAEGVWESKTVELNTVERVCGLRREIMGVRFARHIGQTEWYSRAVAMQSL